jgi:type I restriction enzyme S subunit
MPFEGQSKFPLRTLRTAARIELGRMLQPEAREDSNHLVPYIRAANVQNGVLDASDLKEMYCSPRDVATLSLQPGDLLACEGGDVGRVALVESTLGTPTIFQNSVHRVVPRDGMDRRFLFYVLQGLYAESTYYSVLCNAATIRHLTVEKFGTVCIPHPPLGDQRRIAEFLDVHVKLIDRAISLSARQSALLEERRGGSWSQAMAHIGMSISSLDPIERTSDWRPLSKALRQLTNGYVGPTRDLLVDDGVPYLQSLHIKGGGIDFQRRPYYVPSEWVAGRPRIRLRQDDLLIVQTGALGEVALVGPDFVGASCHALLIARVNPSVMRADYLWHMLRSDWGKHSLLRRQTGALHPHLEAGEIRDILIPVPSLSQQEAVVRELNVREVETSRLSALLEKQQWLLRERRQALIMAAVTGHVDVTIARSVAS